MGETHSIQISNGEAGSGFSKHQASSWIWSGIKHCNFSLDNGLCYRVGQNSVIQVREDPWILDLPNFKLPNEVIIPDNIYRVKDLMNEE